MKTDDTRGKTNSELEFDLAKILWEFGEERQSRRFAKAIVEQRKAKLEIKKERVIAAQ